VHTPSNDVFDDFDDEQGHDILGSLQLEADEEPVRRGASRANSVRFDVSALQGSNWAQGSRNSGDFGPVRPSSGFGSHPMTERSFSHKSDGRHSSAGHSVLSIHSVPSGRTSSLGLDTNFMVSHTDDSSLDMPNPPPGLFILGTVPSIIRCWLTNNFSHSALLYAVVCTGSQRSMLDFALVKDLGLMDQMQKDSTGRYIIRLPVYLPEAIITQATARSDSPAAQLPTITIDFAISGRSEGVNPDRKNGINVYLGSDALRAHSADILFSQNLMTLYGDDRNKISVPFVRPEDDSSFKNLCTSSIPAEKIQLNATAHPFTPIESKIKVEPNAEAVAAALENEIRRSNQQSAGLGQRHVASMESHHPSISSSQVNTLHLASETKGESGSINGNVSDMEKDQIVEIGNSSDATRQESLGGIWGSWRQGSENNRDTESSSGYQRPIKGGRNMKVLKPSKSLSNAGAYNRSSSGARTGAAYEPAPSRPSGESRRKSQGAGVENAPLRWESRRADSGSEELKGSKTVASIPRSSNPVGGASAFAWMNSSKPKTSSTTD
jgi:hypothetical protein